MFKRFVNALIVLLVLAAPVFPVFNTANAATPGPNLVSNPSVETVSPTNTTLPKDWQKNKWGTITATFAYKANEGNTGVRSTRVDVTKRTSGDAKWIFKHVAVQPGKVYTFSDSYKASVSSEIVVEVKDAAGKLSYYWLSSPVASATAYKAVSANFTMPANAKTATVFHLINKVGWLQTDDTYFGLADAGTPSTAPTVAITAPANGSTISDTQTVAANATDAVGVSGVQFKLDGVNLGDEDTTAPYTATWDTKTASDGNHTLTAIARNAANLTAVSTVNVTVNNPVTPPPATPPTISFSAPTNSATVSGSQTVTANASDAVGVAGVQFKLDGANLGAEDTTAPYSTTWGTTASTNGSHTLSAVARNTSGLTTTSTITVNVNNVVAPPQAPTNLLSNPSFETGDTTPTSWMASNWGSNTASFSYLNTGRTGSRSVRTEITSYTNGAANWHYANVPVTAGKTYKYENWYQSNVDTEVDAEVLMADGTVQYYYVAYVPASTSWAKVSAQFVAPTGAKAVTIYQILAKTGYVVADDYSLTEYTPAQFNRGMVSLTFDDGWRSIYANGLPLLQKYNLPSTQYLLTETIDYPDYMTIAMMQAFEDQGSEIASHTISHADLATLPLSQLNYELSQSQTLLRQWFGPTAAKNFATPYGSYNSTVTNEIKKYYRSHRSTDVGFNSRDNFDLYNIRVQNILKTTTPAEVQVWINQALADKTWLVLVYHDVEANPSTYGVTPTGLDQQLNIVKQSGITVKTVDQALDEILSQL